MKVRLLNLCFVIVLLSTTSAPAGSNEIITIPLASIITTSPQHGMQHTREAFPQTDGDREHSASNGYLRQILDATKSGASNVFLVDATNKSDALSASFSVLVGSRSAEMPVAVNTSNPVRGSHWLVAYLGSGPSNPTWWTVQSVTVDKRKVALSYRRSRPMPATADVHSYYFWIPLAKLDPGDYELELVDVNKREAVLARRVVVRPPNEIRGKP